MTIPILVLIAAYVIGGIPFGYLLVHLKTGRDVRGMGSGNIGATNVLRNTGPALGVATLLLDIVKGWVAVWLMDRATGGDLTWMSAAAVFVVLGHGFSIFLKFHGGKAVASFIGAFLYLAPVPLLICLVALALIVWRTRYISLGSITAVGLFPLGVWMVLHPGWALITAATICSVFIIWRHRSNIERLRNGTENVFQFGGGHKAA